MFASTRSTWMKVVSIVLALGAGWGVPAYGFAGGTGEPNNPYQIATAADLLSIGSDSGLLKKHFVLINDLDLAPSLPGGRVFDDALIGRDTNPSTSGSTGSPFSGVLDGRGHTIYRLCISGKNGHSAGLFGICRGFVKDLHLEDVQVSGSPCGALAGTTPEGMFLRCSVTGKVTGGDTVGGLIGNAWNATILQCESQVEVNAGSDAGGLVGHALDGAQIADAHVRGTVTGTNTVGGLIGSGNGTMILRCTAACRVTGSDWVGGLMGRASWSTLVLHCESQGEISGGSQVGGLVGGTSVRAQLVESRATGTVTGNNLVGGLIGRSQDVTIRGCAAACDVVGEQTAGGLAGDLFLGASIVDCYARGSVTGSLVGGLVGDGGSSGFPARILNSYAACEMLGLSSTKPPLIGGVLGSRKTSNESIVVSGCFWDTELSKITVATGSGPGYYGTGLTTKQMQQPDVFQQAGWDFNSTWTMAKEGYPALRWESAQDESLPADMGTGPIPPQ